ncbi:MAG TPA: ferritin-like domain-containing protein [Candidatus Binatia bacterium]|nr:ferritin-like domain-containing protein [Candidatus Binatia bacterium]
MSPFSLRTPTQEPGLGTAMQVVYQWSYAPEVEELRRLYVKAAEAQWVAERDLAWDQPLDEDKLAATPLGLGLRIERTAYWRSLGEAVRRELTRRTAVFRLSNFLHGEQGALMVAAQLVNAVPHTDAKFYAATQTMDEARHVEVFARYIAKLGDVHPIAPPLKGILDATLATADWMQKLVGMQIVVEGLALYSFREMRNLTQEPLLREILGYVARDESRHHAYGVQYIERCVPCLGPGERAALEDFAVDAARALIDNTSGQGMFSAMVRIWAEAGIDPVEMLTRLRSEREALARTLPRSGRLGPMQGFVIPTLRRLGLLSERAAGRFHEFLRANLGGQVAGEDLETFLARLPELPPDTAAWALSEIE